MEQLATCREDALEVYLDGGEVPDALVRQLVGRRLVFPCWFGSGLKLEGIDCTALSNNSHIWTVATLDGTDYHIDTTWGDPVFTGGDDSQGPAYEYFGLTTDDLLRTHTIDDKVPVPDCTSNSNNYFFRNGLYFSAYDPDALTALFQRALAAGQRQVSVLPRRLRRPV